MYLCHIAWAKASKTSLFSNLQICLCICQNTSCLHNQRALLHIWFWQIKICLFFSHLFFLGFTLMLSHESNSRYWTSKTWWLFVESWFLFPFLCASFLKPAPWYLSTVLFMKKSYLPWVASTWGPNSAQSLSCTFNRIRRHVVLNQFLQHEDELERKENRLQCRIYGNLNLWNLQKEFKERQKGFLWLNSKWVGPFWKEKSDT